MFIITFFNLMLGFTTPSNATVQPDDLNPIGHQECSPQTLRDIYYGYDLLDVKTKALELEISLAVRNYVCDVSEKNGESIYDWKLVPDESFSVRTSFDKKSFVTSYEPTDEEHVYLAVIKIPYNEILSPEELKNFTPDMHSISEVKNLRFRHWSKSYGALPWSFLLQIRLEKNGTKIFVRNVRD